MRTITYKYNIGDIVKFKDKFHSPTCGLIECAGLTAEIIDRRDYNGPCYKIKNNIGYFKESCFAGLAVASVDTPLGSFDFGADTYKPSEATSDTGENNKAVESSDWFPHTDYNGCITYECTYCRWMALNDYRGNSVASKFCPHCGKYMTNHQQEDEEDV